MRIEKIVTALGLTFGLTLVDPAQALAHCDSLDGPVVKAAQRALDSGDPASALMWVQPKDGRRFRLRSNGR